MDLIRPNQKGFGSLLKTLPSLGFKQDGYFHLKTPYGKVHVFGDKSQNYIPSDMSEYVVVEVKCPINKLDERSQQAVNMIDAIEKQKYGKESLRLMNAEIPAHAGGIKKIRDGFVPTDQLGNGPWIKVSHDGIVEFQWWPRNPSDAYKQIEHLLEKPPFFTGSNLDNGGDDSEPDTPPPFEPTGGGFKSWLVSNK